MATQEEVIEKLGAMTVMELIKLTKDLEAQWGVKAEPFISENSIYEGTTLLNVVEEQTEFNVMLVSYPTDKKMALVKLVREVMNIGLLDSKNLVESLPKMVKEGATKEEAESLQAKFVEVGAVVEVK